MARVPKKTKTRLLNRRLGSTSYLPLEWESGDPFADGQTVTVTRGAPVTHTWSGPLTEATPKFGYAKLRCTQSPERAEDKQKWQPYGPDENVTVTVGADGTATPMSKVDTYAE